MLTNITKYISNNEFTQAGYWFSSSRSNLADILWFFILAAILVIVGLAVLLFAKFLIKNSPPKRKMLIPFGWLFVLYGSLAFVFGFFRLEGIGFFSAYMFWVLVLISLLATVGVFVFRYIRFLPKEESKYESYLLKNKYLPRKRKNRKP